MDGYPELWVSPELRVSGYPELRVSVILCTTPDNVTLVSTRSKAGVLQRCFLSVIGPAKAGVLRNTSMVLSATTPDFPHHSRRHRDVGVYARDATRLYCTGPFVLCCVVKLVWALRAAAPCSRVPCPRAWL